MQPLIKRKLGTQGLEVSQIGLGCAPYGGRNDAEAVARLHRALDLGCNFFDTAPAYGPFWNEELVGRAVHDRRERVVIATKFGLEMADTATITGVNSRPEHIKASVDASLKRLRTDRIDILYQHTIDPNVPIEEVAGAVKELIEGGKVLFFGLSNAPPDLIRRAHAVHPVSALESEYSLFERGVEAAILPCVRELGIGFVAYSPLGRGLLTGAAPRAEELPPEDWRAANFTRIQGANFDANMRVVGFLHGSCRQQGLHAGTDCAVLAASPGRPHRADSEHAPYKISRGEHRRRIGRPFGRRACADRPLFDGTSHSRIAA